MRAIAEAEVAATAEARVQPEAHSVLSSSGDPSPEIVALLSLAMTRDAIETMSLSLQGAWRMRIAHHLGAPDDIRQAPEVPTDLHPDEVTDQDHRTKVMDLEHKFRTEDKDEPRVNEILGEDIVETNVSETSRQPTIVHENEA